MGTIGHCARMAVGGASWYYLCIIGVLTAIDHHNTTIRQPVGGDAVGNLFFQLLGVIKRLMC